MSMIEIVNLSHRYADGTWGLQNVDLTVDDGELVVIAGANGSGKTTLIRHFNGLLLPTAGTVVVAGHDVATDLRRARQTVGMVFQDPDNQIVAETVFQDVAFGPENLGLERTEINRRVTFALKAVGLTLMADRRPHLLSGGEKRRLALAGILAMRPKVLALDEPFAGLDFAGTREVLMQILFLHRSGHTIVITTHDLEKIVSHADRLVLLEGGRVARNGSPAAVLPDVEAFGVRAPCAVRLGMEVRPWWN